MKGILERIDYRGRHFSRADIGGFHCHTLQPFYRRDIERLPEYHVPLLVLYRFGRYLPVGCDCSLFAGEDVDQTGRYYFVGVGQ